VFELSLSTTNPAWIGLCDPTLGGDRPAINCLRYGTALTPHCINVMNNRMYITCIHIFRRRNHVCYKQI
jgi:hypothetical protein